MNSAYIESLNQLATFRALYPDGIKVYTEWTEGIHAPNLCNIPKPFCMPLDLSQPIDRDAVEQVADWMVRRKHGKAKPWLILHGDMRTRKTGSAVMAGIGLGDAYCRDLFSDMTYFRFVRAADFARIASTPRGNAVQFTAVENLDYPNEENEFYYDGVLLDDFCKMAFSDKVVSELFNLFDGAEQAERGIVVTTQSTGATLAGMMLGKNPDAQRASRVQAILGRIADHSEFIHFQKPPTNKEI